VQKASTKFQNQLVGSFCNGTAGPLSRSLSLYFVFEIFVLMGCYAALIGSDGLSGTTYGNGTLYRTSVNDYQSTAHNIP